MGLCEALGLAAGGGDTSFLLQDSVLLRTTKGRTDFPSGQLCPQVRTGALLSRVPLGALFPPGRGFLRPVPPQTELPSARSSRSCLFHPKGISLPGTRPSSPTAPPGLPPAWPGFPQPAPLRVVGLVQAVPAALARLYKGSPRYQPHLQLRRPRSQRRGSGSRDTPSAPPRASCPAPTPAPPQAPPRPEAPPRYPQGPAPP